MPKWQSLMKGDYLAAVEFGDRQPTFTMIAVKVVKLKQEDDTEKDKAVVFFKETPRGWVLNKTNAQCIAAMFGDECDGWAGKRVTLFAMDVRVGPKVEPGIRVKGSPDIEKPVQVSIKMPRKKPTAMQMVPTQPPTVTP